MATTLNFKIIHPEINDLALLDKTEAIVIEGLVHSDVEEFLWWIHNYTEFTHKTIKVYEISGATLNEAWTLTGTNRYPNDLNVVAVSFDEMKKPGALAIPRFSVGARWWSDVLNNNLQREADKHAEEMIEAMKETGTW